jgi:hypothetical protein
VIVLVDVHKRDSVALKSENAHIVEFVDADTVHKDIVGSMDVKAFFDLSIWR